MREEELKLEVRRFKRGKEVKLKLFDRLFIPTTRCHTNDRTVRNAITIRMK